MAKPRAPESRFDFRGGLNGAYSDELLDATELREAKNVRLGVVGAMRKRGGTKRIHDTALASGADVLGLFQWDAPGGKQVIAIAGTSFCHKLAAGTDFTTVSSTFSTTNRPRFVPYRIGATIELFIADGTYRKWTGSALTAVTDAPALKWIANYKLRIFGGTGTKSLYYSPIGDPTTFPDQADVETFDSEGIVNGIVVGDSLLLFKEDNVARFTGTDPSNIRIAVDTIGVSSEAGLIAPAALVRVEDPETGLDVAFFLSDRGPYFATEGGITFIGDKVSDAFEELGRSTLAAASAVHHKRLHEIRLHIPGVGTYVYHYRIKAWSGPYEYSFGDPYSACPYERADGTESVLVGGGDGFVRETDVGALDDVLRGGTGGDEITLDARLPDLFFGDPARVKHLRKVQHVAADLGASGELEVYWSSEQGSGSVTIDSLGAGVKDYPFKVAARGKRIRLGFREATANAVQINGCTLEASIGGRR